MFTFQGMGRRRLSNGDEFDVVYSRDQYTYLHNNPKNVKDAKKRINRRERANSRRALRHPPTE